jgi:hypothetical protein
MLTLIISITVLGIAAVSIFCLYVGCYFGRGAITYMSSIQTRRPQGNYKEMNKCSIIAQVRNQDRIRIIKQMAKGGLK